MRSAPPEFLAKKNPHPRDADITFEEGPHLYTVYGKQGYTSVTTLVHQHFPHFDADAIAQKCADHPTKRHDPTYKYYGMTKDQIVAAWTENGRIASGSGTLMHANIESYYNEEHVDDDSIEFGYFRQFVRDHAHLVAYRTEWVVFYEEYMLTGSIDMIFQPDPEGDPDRVEIYDWKRSKGIEYESFGNKTAITPFLKHLPDTNYNHYSLQLNIYRKILEDKYGKRVTRMCLVIMHPDSPSQTYEHIEVPRMNQEIDDLFAHRAQYIRDHHIVPTEVLVDPPTPTTEIIPPATHP